MTKTLGQVNRDGHQRAVETGATVAEAWQAAAEAVVHANRADPWCLPDKAGHTRCPRCRAHRAVIEAAKLFIESPSETARRMLEGKVRALQKVSDD